MPALSSAPSRVVPSVTISSSPAWADRPGHRDSVRETASDRGRSPPSYRTMRGFTFSPEASGDVSMWAMRASTGAVTPAAAGRVAMTLPAPSMWAPARPRLSSSASRTRPRSFCRSVEGDAPVCSSEVV